MKKILFLTAALCLLAVSAFAQNKADFSGDWELDTVRSKMDERMRVESMTMKVQQTEKDITVGTFTKRAMSSDGSGMNGGGGITPTALTYSLEGKETEAALSSGMAAGQTKLKASLDANGKLNLSSVRTVSRQMSQMTVTVKETWQLEDGGNTLKVTRNMETPRGTQNSELIFTKKDTAINSGEGNGIGGKVISGTIGGGVLNGKATSLAKPEYPAAAKAVKATGAVNVQITIDEQGNVISAEAVSGHPLLRTAAEKAAHESKFTPTLLQGVPVKVTGIVVYNFEL